MFSGFVISRFYRSTNFPSFGILAFRELIFVICEPESLFFWLSLCTLCITCSEAFRYYVKVVVFCSLQVQSAPTACGCCSTFPVDFFVEKVKNTEHRDFFCP
eukprot:RCo042181